MCMPKQRIKFIKRIRLWGIRAGIGSLPQVLCVDFVWRCQHKIRGRLYLHDFRLLPQFMLHLCSLLRCYAVYIGSNIFKPTVGHEKLHESRNDNDTVNFSTFENLSIPLFPHWNIHKYTWSSPDGKTHSLSHWKYWIGMQGRCSLGYHSEGTNSLKPAVIINCELIVY